ncbi:MAG: YggS family pyridoxal phosphate-dependent enzyme [bacterium]
MIEQNLTDITNNIHLAARRAGRNPDRIKLVAVSKTRSVQEIEAAIRVGQNVFGESRIQEAAEKIPHIPGSVEWHLIGHLQSNKVKTAVQLFNVIHSLDSLKLAKEIDRWANKLSKIQLVLIQVNIAEETSKFGVSVSRLADLIDAVKNAKNIRLLGLMVIPPYFDDPEEARVFFRRLKEIAFDQLVSTHYIDEAVLELSMGMSNDYQVAIEEGATMVRIGTAIFGERVIG